MTSPGQATSNIYINGRRKYPECCEDRYIPLDCRDGEEPFARGFIIDILVARIAHLLVRDWTNFRRSSSLRASRSMLWTTSVSPSRAKVSMASSWGRLTSLPEAFSVKTRSSDCPSNWRSTF